MPINAVCPECQNSFRLQDGMVGKSMRCPVCQEVFVVRDSGAPPARGGAEEKAPPADSAPRPRTDSPPVVSRSGNISDFVPLVRDVESAAPARPVASPPPIKPREPVWTGGPKPPKDADFPWNEGGRLTPLKAPKEMTWSPELELVAPAAVPPPLPDRTDREYEEESEDEADERDRYDRERIRPKKKKTRLLLLTLMLVFVIGLGGVGAFLGIRYYRLAPERMFETASKNYEDGRYDDARKQFETIASEYPHYERVPEARFLAELSRVRHLIGSVKNREEPKGSIDAWTKFTARIQEDQDFGEFAGPTKKGVDVWQAGGKLLEDVAAKANDVFDQDKPEESENWLKEAAEIEQSVDQFRPETVGKPDRTLANMANLRAKIDSAHVRQSTITTAQTKLGSGSEEEREAAERYAKEHGLEQDPAFKALLSQAERKIQEKAAYIKEPKPIAPTAVPDDGLTSLLFAPRFDRAERRPLPGLNTVFYCLARGILYALDEPEGRVLWAARTGLDTDIMPVRVRASEQNPEMVLVASNTGNQFGITARAGRDGRPLWHQPLAIPCHGTPAVVGSNVYVSLGDKDGTVLEIILATGEIIGKIVIGRPLGPVMAARPGTGHLYIPADSRAVYVFDVDRRGPEPEFKKLEPALLGAMTANHATGTLRGVPVFSNPDPNEPGPRFLVLGEAAGLERMKLRTIRLPDDVDAKPDASNVHEIALPGWASFPPYCDGEKLAIVTDRGEFGLYGLALDQNPRDDPLFTYQTPKPSDQRSSRGQVVMAEEGTFWIMAAGQLRKFRFGINMSEGIRAVPYGDPVHVGEPLHAPQVNGRGDTFVVVTQDGMACRATAVDSNTGEVRWRRELGLIAKGDPLQVGNAIIVLDQGGGFYRIETKPLTEKVGAAWLLDEKWLIAQPARGFTAYSGLIPGPGGTALALMVGEGESAGKLLIRKFSDQNKSVDDYSVPAPALPAGQPVVLGDSFVIPLADGSLYRLPIAGARALQQGPTWRGDRLPATVTCFLAPISEDELFATDGARGIARLHWSAMTQFFETRGRMQVSERTGVAPVVVPGSPARIVTADSRGNLTMWDGDRFMPPAPPVLKSWRPNDKNTLPAGRVEDLRLVTDAGGKHELLYTVGGRLVLLPIDADRPKWVGPDALKAIEGRPAFDNGRVVVTDRAGVVRVIDAKAGKLTGDEFHLTGSHAFASAAIPLAGNRILVALADGTLVLGELKSAPAGKDK